jgi:hypothetical protein
MLVGHRFSSAPGSDPGERRGDPGADRGGEGERRAKGAWIADPELLLRIDVSGQRDPMMGVRDGSVDQRFAIEGATVMDNGIAFAAKPMGGGGVVGIDFYRPEGLPAPLDPPLPGGSAEDPLPTTDPPPTGAWFVRLPNSPGFRSIAWVPGEMPGGDPGEDRDGRREEERDPDDRRRDPDQRDPSRDPDRGDKAKGGKQKGQRP